MPKIRKSLCILISYALSLHSASGLTLEGRLPGEFFREDNPPRFGALISFNSTSNSVVVLHAVNHGPDYSVAAQLAKIAKGFKVPQKTLTKIGAIEGHERWLQYTFRKQKGGGVIYVTRSRDTIIYLVIFNLKYDALSHDLPYIDRYLKILQVRENE